MQAKQLCVLIPSLEPDERLPVYVDALLAADFGQIVIVNDGSSAQYDAIFDSLAARERCVVLKHEVNRGKGQALRTGVAYIRYRLRRRDHRRRGRAAYGARYPAAGRRDGRKKA